jgi:hypothetical protein
LGRFADRLLRSNKRRPKRQHGRRIGVAHRTAFIKWRIWRDVFVQRPGTRLSIMPGRRRYGRRCRRRKSG